MTFSINELKENYEKITNNRKISVSRRRGKNGTVDITVSCNKKQFLKFSKWIEKNKPIGFVAKIVNKEVM